MAVAVNQHYRKSTEEKELEDEAITSGRPFTTLRVGEVLLVLWTYSFLLPSWALDLFMSRSGGKNVLKTSLETEVVIGSWLLQRLIGKTKTRSS